VSQTTVEGALLEKLRVIDPGTLDREELVALVSELKAALLGADGARQDSADADAATPVIGTERSYTIVFDGGSLGNPGRGYGSYAIFTPKSQLTAHKLELGERLTNNQAEFMALIDALELLVQAVGTAASDTSVTIRGDSQLVIRGLSGDWRIKNPRLLPLYRHAKELLDRFGHVDLVWQPRVESYRMFGH
jgi:ribonuclease HI